jgi:hypothetical protein
VKDLEIVNSASVIEARCIIRYGAEGFTLAIVGSDGAEEIIAKGPRARRLAEYAFNAGAKECRHEYDLRGH